MQSLLHDTHIFGSSLLAKYVLVVALLCGREAIAQKQKSGFFRDLFCPFLLPAPSLGIALIAI